MGSSENATVDHLFSPSSEVEVEDGRLGFGVAPGDSSIVSMG